VVTSIRPLLAFVALLLFTGLPAHAQSTAAPGTAEPAVALQGMDVVSYFKDGGPVKGQAAFREDFDGARYLFSSAQNKAAFVADPDRYLPQYAGLCTTGLSKGFRAPADPNAWRIVGGKLYLFRSPKDIPADEHLPQTIANANRNSAKRP
jgi:YHS domain-containing protein